MSLSPPLSETSVDEDDLRKKPQRRVRRRLPCSCGLSYTSGQFKAHIRSRPHLERVRDQEQARSKNHVTIVWVYNACDIDVPDYGEPIECCMIEMQRTIYNSDVVPKCFSADFANHVGDRIVQTSGDYVAVHEAAVIVSMLGEDTDANLMYREFDQLFDQLKRDPQGFVSTLDEHTTSLLFMFWSSNEPNIQSLTQLHRLITIDIPQVWGFRTTMYPSLEEICASQAKLPDIRIMDSISKTLDPKHSFRPRTCLSTLPGTCTLPPDIETVVKRTHSSCNSGVTLRPTRDFTKGRLVCRTGDIKQSRLGGPRHFHQEFIPSLEHTEFRVMIVADTSLCGARVLEIFRTSWEENGSVTTVVLPQSDQKARLYRDRAASKTVGDLREYALLWYQKLRAHPGFASLEVAARLDIALSDEGDFFINEVTREWYGDHFASRTAVPYLEIPRAIAEARAKLLNDL